MKKALVLLGLVAITAFGAKTQHPQTTKIIAASKSVVLPQKTQHAVKSIFVPYWTISSEYDSSYDEYIYFGVTATEAGLNIEEPGYLAVNSFIDQVPEKAAKVVTLRMIGQNSFKILENKGAQQKVIQELVSFAKAHQFSGVVLDLEVSSLAFSSVIENINSFTKDLSKKTKMNNLSFGIALFGDSFFRIRPYDVKTLSEVADMVYIMAYDFHKANGDPGPNFPMSGKDTYGYDFTVMTDDFLKVMPKEKITVVFGMFGYDWTVDENQMGVQQAKPMSDREIAQQFILKCSYTQCLVSKDSVSLETKVTYVDAQNKNHIVWFEDLASSQKKQEYLKTKGITSVSFWANSYF